MVTTDTKKVSRIKVSKKVWYRIIAPNVFGQKELGETYLSSPESAVGRTMKINLRDLTGNVKDQNVYISFKVNRVDGSSLRTDLIGYELAPTYVKKLVRKNTVRIDDYFSFKTKNGENVIIKTIIITLHKAQRSVKNQVRRQLESVLEEEIKTSDFATFLSSLVNHKIQSAAKKGINRIYPIRELAVRVFSLREAKPEANEVIVEEKKTKTKENQKGQKTEAVKEPILEAA